MTAKLWFSSGIALALLVVQASAQPAQVKPPPAQPAATVNGEVIGLDELEPIVGAMIREKFKTQPPTDVQKHEMRLDVLNMMIDDVLMRQFLTTSGPKVEPAAVDKQLAEMASKLAEQKRTLADFYKESNQTEAQVRSNILHMLQWTEYVKSKVSDEVVKKYYDDNKEFFDQIKVRASHIVIRNKPGMSPGQKEDARKQLLAIKADIEAKKIDFADAAKKYSECPSGPNGGDIGEFPRKWVLEESFAKAAFALKVGEISGVIETGYGLHLIKVTNRTPGTPSNYEKIKDEVRGFCVEELQQDLMTQERAKAKITILVP
jgi:peptidyl-prolyl cis-trans isomerase C